jgi:hypothetical protein
MSCSSIDHALWGESLKRTDGAPHVTKFAIIIIFYHVTIGCPGKLEQLQPSLNGKNSALGKLVGGCHKDQTWSFVEREKIRLHPALIDRDKEKLCA